MTYVYINGFSCVLQFPPFLVFVDFNELVFVLGVYVWRNIPSPFPSLHNVLCGWKLKKHIKKQQTIKQSSEVYEEL